MAFTTYTVTGNIGAGFDAEFASRLKFHRAWAEPSQPEAADSVANRVSLGAIEIDVDEAGHFVATLPATNQTGAPAGWYINVRYSQPPKLSHILDKRYGPFELEANREFAAILNNGFISLVPVNEETIESIAAMRDEVVGQVANFVGRAEPATYTYNLDGTVATETVGGFTTTYAYNADGSVNTVTRNGVTLTYTYDANGNVTAVA